MKAIEYFDASRQALTEHEQRWVRFVQRLRMHRHRDVLAITGIVSRVAIETFVGLFDFRHWKLIKVTPMTERFVLPNHNQNADYFSEFPLCRSSNSISFKTASNAPTQESAQVMLSSALGSSPTRGLALSIMN